MGRTRLRPSRVPRGCVRPRPRSPPAPPTLDTRSRCWGATGESGDASSATLTRPTRPGGRGSPQACVSPWRLGARLRRAVCGLARARCIPAISSCGMRARVLGSATDVGGSGCSALGGSWPPASGRHRRVNRCSRRCGGDSRSVSRRATPEWFHPLARPRKVSNGSVAGAAVGWALLPSSFPSMSLQLGRLPPQGAAPAGGATARVSERKLVPRSSAPPTGLGLCVAACAASNPTRLSV
jgi:hypothetical protein